MSILELAVGPFDLKSEPNFMDSDWQDNEDEFAWLEDEEDDIEEMRKDIVHLECQIRGLEEEFRMTLAPDVLIALSRARRNYIEALDVIDFLRMRMVHRLEWQLHPIGGRR